MVEKSDVKKKAVAQMKVVFYEGHEVEVTFTNWEKLTPGRIDRSMLQQVRAWEAMRAAEVQRTNKDAFQKSLDMSITSEEKVDG